MEGFHQEVTNRNGFVELAHQVAQAALQMAGKTWILQRVVMHGNPDSIPGARVHGFYVSFYYLPDAGSDHTPHLDVEITCVDHEGTVHNFSKRHVSFTEPNAETGKYRSWEIEYEEGVRDLVD